MLSYKIIKDDKDSISLLKSSSRVVVLELLFRVKDSQSVSRLWSLTRD